MGRLRVWFERLKGTLLPRAGDERLAEELQAHLDLLADEYVAKGMAREDARLAARKAFGGVDQMAARYRDQRGFPLLAALAQDVRFATRLFVRDRWFTAATVLALALGMGVSTTLLSILYSMNFRELPFDNASAIVAVRGEPNRVQRGQVPFAVFEAWQSASTGFAALAAHVDSPITLGDETRAADQFAGTFISHDGFGVLGERAVLGRGFLPADDRPGAPPVAIIGYRVWTDRYGSDPAVIGRTVRANGQPATVIGVMPDGFRYPIDTQVWRPLASLPAMSAADGRALVQVVGRLADGVSLEQARAELAAIVSMLATVTEADRTRRTLVIPLNEAYVGKATQATPMMMLGASLIVLLIACSHAASLLIARSSARAREMSMRAALGASRGRIVRQLLVESVLMAIMAGILGAIVAAIGLRVFANETAGFGMPYWTRFSFDARLFACVGLLSVATGVTFGLLPAFHLSSTRLTDVLNQGGRSGMRGPRGRRLTGMLLAGELALTLVLLASAGMLVQSANAVYQADQMLDLADLWQFRLSLPQPQYASRERRVAFYRELDRQLAAAPAMESAALASSAPFAARETRGVVMDDEPLAERDPERTARIVAIGDRYFDTLGLSLARGTRFKDLDRATLSTAALVDERFAQRFSPGVDPVGRQVLLVNDRLPDLLPQRFTIVGIAPPIRHEIAAGYTPVVYVPHATEAEASAFILVRGQPDRFAEGLRQEVRRLDPDLPVFGLQSLERTSYMSRWIQRITSTVFSTLALIATVLSALGLYALTAYTATERTQEVGLRMALGARRSQVSWLFFRGAVLQVSIGLPIGLAGAVAAGALLQGMLVDVRPNQPLLLVQVSALLIAVSVAASILPARRAARVDPVVALRHD